MNLSEQKDRNISYYVSQLSPYNENMQGKYGVGSIAFYVIR